jgi:hypothetical protein
MVEIVIGTATVRVPRSFAGRWHDCNGRGRAEAGRIRRDHKAETAQGRDGSRKTFDEIVDM